MLTFDLIIYKKSTVLNFLRIFNGIHLRFLKNLRKRTKEKLVETTKV